MVKGGTELDSEARVLYSHPYCDKVWGFLRTLPAWPGSIAAGMLCLLPGGEAAASTVLWARSRGSP